MTPALTASPVVFGALLAAAALHAGWNAFLKVRLEPFLVMTLITASAGLIGLPFLLVLGVPKAASWPWLLGSLVLHLGYYVTLTEAYRRAEMSQVYPIARGGAPLLTALASFLLVAEPVSAQATAGVVILGAGVILISLGGRRSIAMDQKAIAFALLTALIIAFYTLVDGIGARTAGNPGAYAAALFVLDGLPLPLFALWRRGVSPLVKLLRHARQGLLGGAMSVASYWIAIWAMTVAPIAVVAALRGTSVLFSVAIATFVLKEAFRPVRCVAALLIMGGILLIH
ncbi:EamA family transporter [Acidiphilium sp. AL]|uniref:EamA family transporter n=1 Tax=Acidiphilium iwatense TaxID=768198 RepID=A0ABS9E1C9_9PROT|nr:MULTISPECIES: EamA family transporter [Acidiphilium]MCF3948215.1 EamA family transporter [Acidiphilium iwatense]MCU4161668.1 EamA family transporter [Acidiphilium sp. AL]